MNFDYLLPNENILKSLEGLKNPVYAVAEENYASNFFDQILDRVKSFDESLDNDHEVGIKLVTFGQSITFSVSEIGYKNPSLIIFRGVIDDNSKVELIQHVTQISFLLMAVKRKNPSEPKRKIGFISESETQEL